MPTGFFHESWKRIAQESDAVLSNPIAAIDRYSISPSLIEMVQAELLLIPIHRIDKGIIETTITKPYKDQFVRYTKEGHSALILSYKEVTDKELVADGWTRELKMYSKVWKHHEWGEFERTGPLWIPLLKRQALHPDAFKKCPQHVTRLYNATFPKKIHISGHLWIEPVRIVSPRVTFDNSVYQSEPHIDGRMARTLYSRYPKISNVEEETND